MKAYWVVRASISDSEEYSIYRELAGPIVASFNGVFLSRGGSQEEVEGSGYQRTVIVEFNSFEEATSCYHSNDYQKALEHTKNSSERLFSIVEGV